MRRHHGPYFSNIDREMTRQEILDLYTNVPIHYRNGTFWNNFTKLCMGRGWIKNQLEARSLLRNHQKSEGSQGEENGNPEKHKFCLAEDGTREPITNWKMEPPMVFIGRGHHPARGCLKRRVVPEDVILNLDSQGPVPKLPRGRHWAEVVSKPECEWLWSWMDPLLKKLKYVYPAAVSQAHAEREECKFDDAMELGVHIENIRKFYQKSLARGEYLELSCILYLIDHLGIRIGNDQNVNVDGATTLRVRGVRVVTEERRRVRIQFTGKDSIEYDNQIQCSTDFIRAIRELSRGKHDHERLFPNVTPKIVNEYLQSHHPSLTAKTFRTYNATIKMREGLDRYRPELGCPVDWFRKCATEVAAFCNHKKISTLKKTRDQFSPSTAMTNYIDPRVVVSWAKSQGVPIQKLYPKSLRERFTWAIHNSKE